MSTLADLFVRILPDDVKVNRSIATIKKDLTQIDRTKVRPKIELPDERASGLTAMQAKLQALSRMRIKLNVDSSLAGAEVTTLQRQLQRLTTQKSNIPLHLQTGINDQIAAVERDLASATKRQHTIPLRVERITGQLSALQSSISVLERESIDIPVEVDQSHLAKEGAQARRTLADSLSRGSDYERAGRASGSRFAHGLSSAAGAGLSSLKAGLAGVAIAGAAAAGAAGAVGIKTAAGLETARIGFTTMLGSAKEADSFLRDLADFAAQTPFEFPDLQRSASQLVAIGIDAKDVIPIMTTLGDITAGMGTGAEGIKRATVAIQQMNAAGRIQAEDLNQLRDAGVPVYELLAKATGKSVKQIAAMAQTGKLGRKELDQLMASLKTGNGLERFNGLMEKSSQSMAGLWATLKDTFNMGMAQAIAPAIPLIKKGLGGAISFVGKAMPAIASGLSAIGKVVGPVASRIKGLFSSLGGGGAAGSQITSSLGPAVAFIQDKVVPGIQAIGGAYRRLFAVIAPIARQIGAAIREVIGGEDTGALIANLKDVIVSGLEFIKARIEGITKAISVIWAVWGDDITAVVKGAYGFVIPFLSNSLKVIAGIFKTLAALMNGDFSGAFQGLKQIVKGQMDNVVLIFSTAWSLLKGVFMAQWGPTIQTIKTNVSTGVQLIRDIWSRVVGIFSGVMSQVLGVVTTAWAGIKNVTATVVSAVAGAIKAGVNLWLTPLKIAFTIIGTIVVLGWGLVSKVTSAVWGAVYSKVIAPVWAKISGAFRAGAAAVTGASSALWARIRAIFSAAWNAVYSKVIAPVWARIRSAFSSAMSAIRSGVSAFMSGLRSIISAGWNAVHDKIIAPVWNRIRGAFTSAQSSVQSKWDGFWGRIKSIGKSAMDSVKKTIDTVLDKIKHAFSVAKDNIGATWDKVKGKVSGPINWIKDHVYNKPLVPVWNRVAKLVDGPKLKTYATGGVEGVRPGYTPGRDTHLIGVGGGEAIMRPEWTRAVGPAMVHAWNRIARTRGVKAVRKAMAQMQAFSVGGIADPPALATLPTAHSWKTASKAERAEVQKAWLHQFGSFNNAPIEDMRISYRNRFHDRDKAEKFARTQGDVVKLGRFYYAFADAARAKQHAIEKAASYTRSLAAWQTAGADERSHVQRAWLHQFGSFNNGSKEDMIASYRNRYRDKTRASVFARRGGEVIREGKFYYAFAGRPTVHATATDSPVDGTLPVQGFKVGGIVKKVIGGVKKVVSKVKSLASTIKGWVVGGLKSVASKAFDRVRDAINTHAGGAPGRGTVAKIGNKALDLTLKKIGIEDAKELAKQQAAAAASAGSLGGGGGKKMSGSIISIARRFHPSYIAGHRDPQGGPAYDIGSSGAKNNAIANALRVNHGRLGLRYVISQMRITSARSPSWRWRRYTPITGSGDFRHVGHVHVSYKNGGIFPGGRTAMIAPRRMAEGGVVRGGRGGVLAHVGEGRHDELVTPLPKGWKTATGRDDASLDRLIRVIEERGLNGPSFSFGDVYNPREEALSQTINAGMQRVAALGLL